MWLGVPLAAGLPVGVALGAAGWGPLAVLAAALEAPRLPRLPVLGIVAALCGVAAGGWCAAGARSGRALGAGLAGAFAAGALAVAAARSLPVYLAGPGARLADGSGIGGSVVRVERLWPGRPDRLHVLLGAGRVGRGDVLHLQGGQPARFLRGEVDYGDGRPKAANPDIAMKFWRDHASYPFRSHDLWFLTENVRWGMLPQKTDLKAMVEQVNRENIWRAAAERAGVKAAETPQGASRGTETFFDGKKFDPENPAAYLASQPINRRDRLRVALVGYTNAGKSSLMRALTGSEVLVEDKLFATLDTTVRALQPETRPRVLVSDTVGFIKQLPHDLVASFRSTLAEALEASLLLFVVDASDPTHEAQLEVSRGVLREIGADAVPSRLVLNKLDRVDAAGRAALAEKHPDAILLSAHAPEDVSALRDTVVAFFEAEMVEDVLVVPYAKQRLIGEVYESARVLSEEHGEAGRVLKVRGLPGAIARLRRSLAAH